MKQFSANDLANICTSKGYELKTDPYHMNIFAIRTNDMASNAFNDYVGVLYKTETGIWNHRKWDATTDAGLYYRENPIAVDGTAIIVPGQYKKCYKVGLHKGYEAIEQVGNIKYIRDNNKNKVLDWIYNKVGAKFITGIFKTNIHHAGVNSIQVDKWSAGCIVFARLAEFKTFMGLIKSSIDNHGLYTFLDLTLLEENDFA